MKSLSDLSKAFLRNLPRFTETDFVSRIMNRGCPKHINPHKRAHELVCPICGNSEGYRVYDALGLWWACRSSDCIKLNAPKKKEPATYKKMCETLPDGYRLATFKDYRHGREKIMKIAEWYRGNKPYLILSGTNGSGKTYTAAATINEHLKEKNKGAVFANISDLYMSYLEEKGTPEFARRMERLCSPDLVVLDDIGHRVPSDSFQDLLYVLVNRRSNSLQKTIITTNFIKKERFSEKFGEAITSRIMEGTQIKMSGEDQRKK